MSSTTSSSAMSRGGGGGGGGGGGVNPTSPSKMYSEGVLLKQVLAIYRGPHVSGNPQLPRPFAFEILAGALCAKGLWDEERLKALYLACTTPGPSARVKAILVPPTDGNTMAAHLPAKFAATKHQESQESQITLPSLSKVVHDTFEAFVLARPTQDWQGWGSLTDALHARLFGVVLARLYYLVEAGHPVNDRIGEILHGKGTPKDQTKELLEYFHSFRPGNTPAKQERDACWFHLNGGCKNGDKCKWSHTADPPSVPTSITLPTTLRFPVSASASVSATADKPARTPTIPCMHYNRGDITSERPHGACTKGKECTYLHVCQHDHRGRCRNGEKCSRRHTPKSSPPKPTPKVDGDGFTSVSSSSKSDKKVVVAISPTPLPKETGFSVLMEEDEEEDQHEEEDQQEEEEDQQEEEDHLEDWEVITEEEVQEATLEKSVPAPPLVGFTPMRKPDLDDDRSPGKRKGKGRK